ncbi:hypothetical protein UO65_4835 [Actinokineospora spheciospongiae]|uniref:Uncharacterized protein n=1 Tax=Actinokineospora spheciospongiae TaxID=909613 RepID=W7ISV9_9PSEU|nr:hypothetical protein UO65_4835 [Actinokineospora spheciospongiae]
MRRSADGRSEPTRPLRHQHPAGAAHSVPDGDLTGVHRVGPGERLVGADVPGTWLGSDWRTTYEVVYRMLYADAFPAG